MSSYTRDTELRNVQSKDLFHLAVILDDDNYWQTLMEIIPKEINNQTFGTTEDLEKISSGTAYERKYSNDHIRLVENAARRPGESRLCSQILFDEWSSSGRKHERPTLGVLIHLLVQSKLFRAADFVAELINEPKPSRPNKGPAAEFEFKINVFKDIEETVNDTRYYPNTEDLQENANIDINKDYYTKYLNNVDKKMSTLNDNTKEAIMTTPKPPPRLLKSARLLKQQEILQKQQLDQLQEKASKTKSYNTVFNSKERHQHYNQENSQSNNESVSMLSSVSTNNRPNLSALMNSSSNIITTNCSLANETLIPKISTLNNSSEKNLQTFGQDKDCSLNSTPSLIFSKPNIVEDYNQQQHSYSNSIPVVVLSKSLNTEHKYGNSDEVFNDLPAISALNLNGERDEDASQHQSSNMVSVPPVALNSGAQKRNRTDESGSGGGSELIIPCLMENTNYDENFSRHQLEAIEEDYNGIEHERDNDVDFEDDEDSIPNLSFLENRSSNNESSLTSVTNTSGDNSFDQSVNDCSSTSTDNVPFLSVLNQ